MGASIGTYANTGHVQELQRGTSGAIHIRGLAELSYTVIVGEKQDQLASPAINRTTVLPGGQGANFLVLEYMEIAATTVGKRLFVVFNAQSNADANAKLGTPGQRYVVPIRGWREWAFEPAQGMLTRLDFCSDATSESNATVVTWEYGLLLS